MFLSLSANAPTPEVIKKPILSELDPRPVLWTWVSRISAINLNAGFTVIWVPSKLYASLICIDALASPVLPIPLYWDLLLS